LSLTIEMMIPGFVVIGAVGLSPGIISGDYFRGLFPGKVDTERYLPAGA
jgi:hypothetical protein